MKYLAIGFYLLLINAAAFAIPGDTLVVTTHNKTTVVTDPSKGENSYKSWGVFPTASKDIRKIIMHVTFACPDTMRCADWDYMDRISIMRTGGVNGKLQNYEVGRMLTPYGGAFGKSWRFSWEVDVTDFSLLLRDSVEIEYKHNGWEPNTDRGWAITVRFEMIKGKPAFEPVSIQKIYDDHYRYGDSTQPIETALRPVSFKATNAASFTRLRLVQTGHGMDEPDGCSEFCNKYREVYFDGKLVNRRNRWKKCGDNPLYPQAGTWVIDRANWCPGDLVQPDVFDLPVKPGHQHSVDVNMQNYTATKPSATEVITAYLIQYKKAAAQNDIALEEIIVPSLKSAHQRLNPAGAAPQIVVKNLGAIEITRFTVEYGTQGFAKKRYNWIGSLSPAASDTITLPGFINATKGQNVFVAELQSPNGKKDGYLKDNLNRSTFEKAPVHDNVVVFYLRTNNQPEQNAYTLKNSSGTVVGERILGTLKAATEYRDTFKLAPGAYQLSFVDTADNGLEFWFNRRGGRGLARLLNGNGQMLKTFESDHGSGWMYNFTVGEQPDSINNDEVSIGLYPTRTTDKTTLDYFANKPQNVVVQLVTDPGGKVVEEHIYQDLKEGVFTYNLEHYQKGRFYLKVLVNGVEKFIKRIRFKE